MIYQKPDRANDSDRDQQVKFAWTHGEGSQRLQEVLDNVYAFVGLVSADGVLLEANRAPLEVAGLQREDVIGKPFAETYWWSFSPEAQQQLQAAVRRAAQGESVRFDTPVRIDEGRFISIDFSLRPLFDPDGRVTELVASAVDITERKQTEATLLDSEKRFRQVVENIREVFWMFDRDTKQVVYVSPGYEQVWGRPCAELYKTPRAWTEAIHPEDRERVLAAVSVKQAGGRYNEEYRIIWPDGSVRWILDRGFPVTGENATSHRIVGIAEDITERKQAEERFLRAQRVETIGALTGGIAHDLNNILAPIMMSAPLLRQGLTPEEMEQLLNTIETCAQRGANLVRKLLTYGRGTAARQQSVHPKQLIEEMAKLIRVTFPKNIELSFQVPADLWLVSTDATQLDQVLLNLCVNARDAMPDGGRLALGAENARLDEQHAGLVTDAKPGPYVKIQLTDTGHGIPREITDKIFDPFFTTKETGKGTGLGLATVLGIVKSHGGFVDVRSVVNQGSTFTIYLPAKPGNDNDAPGPATTQTPAGHGELILLADDELPILNVTRQILERNGYRVLVADDGVGAINLYTQHIGEVKAIVTDLDMPFMDGVALARAAKKLTPDLPILACTGICSTEQLCRKIASLRELGVQAFLHKPSTSSNMLNALHDELRRRENHAASGA
jgi:two-component system cell cycle sensor histidine kinase/response regulator CckA